VYREVLVVEEGAELIGVDVLDVLDLPLGQPETGLELRIGAFRFEKKTLK